MSDLIYQDSLRRHYRGDCRAMTELADNSIHCVVTSPPYWSLRKYAGEQELIFDGDPECRHDWGPALEVGDNRYRGQSANTGGNKDPRVLAGGKMLSSFCRKCGAWRGAFGQEPTIELYIEHSLQVLREIRRVLRKDGVVFWNIGDSYAGSMKGRSGRDYSGGPKQQTNASSIGVPVQDWRGLKPTDLCLIPARLSLALQEDGWWVRQDVIWDKLNPMPESVKGWRWERHKIKVGNRGRGQAEQPRHFQDHSGYNLVSDAVWEDCPGCPKCDPNGGYVLRRGAWRPTDAYEHILMLAKSKKYYCDGEAVLEPYTEPLNRWGGPKLKRDTSKTSAYKEMQQIGNSSAMRVGRAIRPNENGRNLRSIWSFPTRSYPGSHFTVFPPRLPEICIKAATPEVGVCPECGAPWARVMERSGTGPIRTYRKETGSRLNFLAGQEWQDWKNEHPDYTTSWQPTCKCGIEDTVPASVLDPFAGSGTTLLVAAQLGRRAVGYDISEDYSALVIERNRQMIMELL